MLRKKCGQPKQCKATHTCDIASAYDAARCAQDQPGGLWLTGITHCTTAGLTCEPQLMMCLPRDAKAILVDPTGCAGAQPAAD